MNILGQTLQGAKQGIAHILIELPARSTGMDRLIQRLELSGQQLSKKIRAIKGRPTNQKTLAHIIGIERWGQRRLRVALGEPFILEEYDSYRPTTQDWDQLLQTFHATRQETISLCKSLRMAGVDFSTRIQHNQFGEISLLGWLFYLHIHASIESARIN